MIALMVVNRVLPGKFAFFNTKWLIFSLSFKNSKHDQFVGLSESSNTEKFTYEISLTEILNIPDLQKQILAWQPGRLG
jgi:hypothetical protein